MKKFFKIIGILLLLCIVIVLGYFIYVYATYYRVADHQQLSISQFATTKTLKTDTQYRISSANIGFGAYSDDYSFFMDGGKYSRARSKEEVKTNVQGEIATIQSLKPDFAMFQEVDVDGTRSYHVNEYQMLEVGLKDYTSVFAQNYDSPYLLYPLNSPHGKNKAGMATFSDVQSTMATRRSLPIETGFSKFMDLDRCYIKQVFEVDNGKRFIVYNVHLSAYTTKGDTATKQLKMLFTDMDQEVQKGSYVIAGGDFNKDLLKDSYAIFKQGDKNVGDWAKPIDTSFMPSALELVAPFDKTNPVPSCRNADRPYSKDDFVLTVDGFIVSKNVQVKEAKVVDAKFKHSDHNPVYLDFSLNQ